MTTTEENCSICLITLPMMDPEVGIAVTTCNHKFHNQCLVTWLAENNTCPNCRKVIVDENQYQTNDSLLTYTNNRAINGHPPYRRAIGSTPSWARDDLDSAIAAAESEALGEDDDSIPPAQWNQSLSNALAISRHVGWRNNISTAQAIEIDEIISTANQAIVFDDVEATISSSEGENRRIAEGNAFAEAYWQRHDDAVQEIVNNVDLNVPELPTTSSQVTERNRWRNHIRRPRWSESNRISRPLTDEIRRTEFRKITIHRWLNMFFMSSDRSNLTNIGVEYAATNTANLICKSEYFPGMAIFINQNNYNSYYRGGADIPYAIFTPDVISTLGLLLIEGGGDEFQQLFAYRNKLYRCKFVIDDLDWGNVNGITRLEIERV